MEETSSPEYIKCIINSFLQDRSVTVDWGSGVHKVEVYKGCPQGSCLGPTLWLLVSETYLRHHPNSARHQTITFADDFLFVFQGQHRRDLERTAQPIITNFNNWTNSKGLEISTTKTRIMTIKHNNRQLKREPTIKINGQNIKATKQITYLGLTISRNRTWLAHLRRVGDKVRHMAVQLNKISGRRWGIDTELIRIWYRTVVQRQIVYASNIWAKKITKEMIKILDHIQRPFLIKMSKAYRTAPTSALQILTGTMPLHILAKAEKFQTDILRLGKTRRILNQEIGPSSICIKAPSNHLPPYQKDLADLINIETLPATIEHTIYTDGSKHDGMVGAAYVTYRKNEETDTWQAKLHENNSVFQAELLALEKAVEQSTNTNSPTIIYTDSRSCLEALLQHDQRNPQVQKLQTILANLNRAERKRLRITWTKAHVGTKGNERADELAKAATSCDNDQQQTLPISYVKNLVKKQCHLEWTQHWEDSDNGRQVYEIFRKPRRNPKLPTAAATAFLTGHGPFISHLHRCTIKRTPTCVCGCEGTAIHYLLQCQLTRHWHIQPPPAGKEEAWGENLLNSVSLNKKLTNLMDWLNSNQDELLYPESLMGPY